MVGVAVLFLVTTLGSLWESVSTALGHTRKAGDGISYLGLGAMLLQGAQRFVELITHLSPIASTLRDILLTAAAGATASAILPVAPATALSGSMATILLAALTSTFGCLWRTP